MSQPSSITNAIVHGAATIWTHYTEYHDRFLELTRQASDRFARRNWGDLQKDALQRLDLYRCRMDRLESTLRRKLNGHARDKSAWRHMKRAYRQSIRNCDDRHGDLFTVDFWRQTQQHILNGLATDIIPYESAHRLS